MLKGCNVKISYNRQTGNIKTFQQIKKIEKL
jgi:hypothetical protein